MPKICAALVLVLLAIGCSGDGDGDGKGDEAAPPSTGSTSTTTTAVTTTTAAFDPGAEYVALGTSYAAGQGIEKQLANCGRSDHNYPSLLAAELDLDLVDVSCGAASTEHLVDTEQGTAQGNVPPQVDAVTADTALVTVTTGGNDVLYSPTAIGCGDPATVCSVDQARLDASFASLQGELATLFSELLARAPDATIVVVPNPRMVYDRSCAELSFTPEEADLVDAIGERLHEVVVVEAEAAGLRIADPYVQAGDHGPCATGDDKWVDGKVATTGFMYHPTAAGHEAMARLVLEELRS